VNAERQYDALVIGAGFAGLRTLHTLRAKGLRVAVLEAGDGIGGVWYWNRYPGARCDVESYDYSYRFSEELEQDWRWSERYATQPEILGYVNHVADRFDLRRDIHLGQRMVRSTWDEDTATWSVETECGDEWTGRLLIMAVGNLSTTKAPKLPGQADFTGRIVHSATWPREGVDLAGQRVGILGTGSSGMQMVPEVAKVAADLTVFQRSANYSVPAANALVSDEEDARIKATYRQRREAARNSPSGLGFVPGRESAMDLPPEERTARYEEAWPRLGFGFALVFRDLLLDQAANDTAADFIRAKVAEQVDDPLTREKLLPRNFPFAAKRPSVDSGYFSTFNRDNVHLIDISEDPIACFTPTGIELRSSARHDLDVFVFATGFDAMTGSLLRPEIVGRAGLTLREHWAAGPRTYLGLFTAGFPNLIVIAGPGSPSLLSNVLLSIEEHVDWIEALLGEMRARSADVVEPTTEAEQRWVDHVNERAEETLYPKARSYYMGDELPGKPRVFMPYVGGVRGYRRILEGVVADGYEGLQMRPAGSRPAAPAGQPVG